MSSISPYYEAVHKDDDAIEPFSESLSCVLDGFGFSPNGYSTKSHYVKPHQRQHEHKEVEILIVSSTDTCAKPYAMMVKLHDTIIADVTVGCSLRPEYHAGLTIFQPVNVVFIVVQIEDSRIFRLDALILRVYLVLSALTKILYIVFRNFYCMSLPWLGSRQDRCRK